MKADSGATPGHDQEYAAEVHRRIIAAFNRGEIIKAQALGLLYDAIVS